MYVKHRFAFNDSQKKLVQFLDKYKIKYESKHGITIFYIFENHEKYTEINNFMNSNNVIPISEAVYTDDEIQSSQWLTIRSTWYNGLYPQPQEDMKYIYITYDTTNYCEGNHPKYYCRKGAVQKDNFILKKEPNWGTRNFMMINWVDDELFVSKKSEEILKNSHLKGFEFYDVLTKSNKVIEGTKQIFIKEHLKEGLCPGSIQKTYICPLCGFVKYQPKVGANNFKKEIFDNLKVDIIKTAEKFSEIACFSFIIVSNKFYRTVKEAKLDRGLVFEPITLV